MGISSFETRDYPFARVITQVVGVVIDVSDIADSRDADGEQALPGLLLGKITASGLYTDYNASDTGNGNEHCQGILMHPVDLTGGDVGAAMMTVGVAVQAACHGYDAGAAADLAKNGANSEGYIRFV